MKEIHELMTQNPIIVHSSTTIHDAIETFIDHGMTSAPVSDNMGEIAGMLTELNLIQMYFRSHGKTDGRDRIAHHLDLLESVQVVKETDGIPETIRELLKTTTHRVVVLDKHKRIKGIVSPKDILRVLSGDAHRLTRLQRDLQEAQETLRKLSGKLNDAEDIIKRYQGYLENAPFLMHSVNEEGKIIMANKRLSDMLGYGPGELVGKTLADLYSDDQVQRANDGLKDLIKNGVTTPVITVMMCKNGDTVRVETSSTALYSDKGKFIGTITMSRRLASDNMLKALHGVLDMSKNPFDDN